MRSGRSPGSLSVLSPRFFGVYESLELDGHRYDIETLNASFEYLHLRSRLNLARAAGRDIGLDGLVMLDRHTVVLDRSVDVHVVRQPEFSDRLVCSCGLLITAGTTAYAGVGHLDQRTWVLAATIVVARRSASYGDNDLLEIHAHCQSCGWTKEAGVVEEGHTMRRAHAC